MRQVWVHGDELVCEQLGRSLSPLGAQIQRVAGAATLLSIGLDTPSPDLVVVADVCDAVRLYHLVRSQAPTLPFVLITRDSCPQPVPFQFCLDDIAAGKLQAFVGRLFGVAAPSPKLAVV